MQNLKYFKFLVVALSFSLFAFSLAPVAQAIGIPGWPLVPCGLSQDNPATAVNESKPCGRCDLFQLLKNLIDFITGGLMPPLAVLLFVWAGFLILLGGANPAWYVQGQMIFKNTFYGLIILLSAWMITNSLILSVGANYNNAASWWQFTCTEAAPVGPPALNLTVITASVPNAYRGSSYSATLSAGGGQTPYTWSVSGGALPSGLSLSSAGVISGTPSKTGLSQFTVKVTDSSSPQKTVTRALSISVNVTGALAIDTSNLADGTINQSYSQQVVARDGVTPYSWSVQGSLPPGLNISQSTGAISGTPTTAGNYNFTVAVKDSSNPQLIATRPLSIVVVTSGTGALSITTSTLPGGTVNQRYSQQLAATGGAQPYRFTVSSGTLPSGLILGLAGGDISGTPTTAGTSTFTVRVTDNSTPQQSATKQLSIVVTGPGTSTLSITTSFLQGGTVNQSYLQQQVLVQGGAQPYRFSISAGSLPAGLSLGQTDGVVRGTPTTAGTSTFTVRVTDNSTPQQSATKQLSIVVTGGILTCGQPWEQNLCQPRSMTCGASACNQYTSAINQYAGRTRVANGVNFLKAIMIKESACNVGVQSGSAPPSCGLMQLQASTANIYKNRCGVSADITCDWLKNPANAIASICIAAEYMGALTQTSCGSTPRGVAAGYNGGSGACSNSSDCAGETSCAGEPVKRWECLYDDPQHAVCNTGYDETRDYATKVLYCYNNPGF